MIRTAIVSGSNKGFGLATVRALCKQFDGDVYLTSRDNNRGRAAVELLQQEGLHPKYHQLDITNAASIQKLHEFMLDTYGGVDVLVNNAATSIRNSDRRTFLERLDEVMSVNYKGTLNMCNAFLPVVKPGGRVVNITSDDAIKAMSACNDTVRSGFAAPCITLDDLDNYCLGFTMNASYRSPMYQNSQR